MNIQQPLVSIITPTYNHAKYIGDCIKSVQAQSYSNWEMIIIDDGSTDNTLEVANSYAANELRIHVIHQENIGIYRLEETYNKALKYSKGEFIAILEGDDYWEPQKLKWQVDVMKRDSSIVMGWGKAAARVKFQKENYQVHPVCIDKNIEYYCNHPNGAIFNVVFDDFIPPLTYMIRKDSLKEIGGFIQVLPFPSVDLSTVLELSKIGKFHFFNTILGTWRIFPEQTTKTLNYEIIEGAYNIILNHFKSLKNEEIKILNFNENFIIENFKKKRIISFSRGGRFKLIRRDFKGARKDYFKALRLYGLKEPIWKLRALTGLILSFFHMDVEKLAALFGRGSLK